MASLRPMTEAEYATWLATAIPAYAADKVESGQWSAATADDRSKAEYEELLPQGLATPDHHLYTLEDDDAAPVGVLWFAVQTLFDARIAYVYDVSVVPHRQREGHALQAFHALEDEVRRLGLAGIALHVFGHNKGARALYAKLGFEPTNISLFKALGEPDA